MNPVNLLKFTRSFREPRHRRPVRRGATEAKGAPGRGAQPGMSLPSFCPLHVHHDQLGLRGVCGCSRASTGGGFSGGGGLAGVDSAAAASVAAAAPDNQSCITQAGKRASKIQVAASKSSSCFKAYFSYSRFLLHSRKRVPLQPHPSKRRLRAISGINSLPVITAGRRATPANTAQALPVFCVVPVHSRCCFRDFAQATRMGGRIWRMNLSQPRKPKAGPIPQPPVRSRDLPRAGCPVHHPK